MRDRLAQILQERGLSARKVSLEAGLSDSLLQKFLTGQIKSLRTNTVEAIAGALDVSPQQLMFGNFELVQENEPTTRPSHYLREWREFRGLSQEQLAKKTLHCQRRDKPT